jgi:sugar lactone lactonase YvrE
MPQDDYSVFTDVSGALLQNLDGVVYQNYDVNYMPVYGKSYKLTNYNQTTTANTFVPYASSTEIYEIDSYMTFNASNTLYMTDRNYTSPSIQVYIEPSGNIGIGRFANIGYVFGDYLSPYPYGIAFDATGILYVTMNDNRNWTLVNESWILKINLTTLVGTRLIVSGATFGSLYGCTFDNSGNFYVADYTNNQITKITMVDYFNGTATTYANLYNGINKPTDICFDSLGNGYISNLGANNVIKISTTNTSSIFGSGLLNPYTLDYNRFTNILYVASYGVHKTALDDPTVEIPGYLVSIVNGTTTRVPGSSSIPKDPYSIAITSTGELYVTQTPIAYLVTPFVIYQMVPNNVINNYITTQDVQFLFIYSVALDRSNTYLYAGLAPPSAAYSPGIWRYINREVTNNQGILFYSNPTLLNGTAFSMDVDASGNIYVVNGGTGGYISNTTTLIRITPAGVGALVTITLPLTSISAIKFDAAGYLYATNYNTNSIHILTFTTPTTASSTLFITSGETISTPTSLSFNNTYTKLYVSCYSTATAVEITISSGVATRYNLTGLTLTTPTSVAYSSSTGVLYVSSASKIFTISSSNVVSEVIVAYSNEPDRQNSFYLNNGITLNNSNSNLYIGNYAFTSEYCPITCLTINNSYLYKYIGDYPTNITSIIFDATYTYLYASTYNNEIWKFTNTSISGNTGFIFYNDSNTGPSLDRPTSMAFDASGNLYAVNTSNSLIVITPAGIGSLVVIAGYALSGPSSIIFNANYSYMYVANYNTNTICRLQFTTTTTATSTLFTTTGQATITPAALSFNKTYTKLYVSCNTTNQIVEITIATGVATLYNQSGNALSLPTGIGYDTLTDILYISNQGTNEIYMGTNDNYIADFSTISTSTNYLSNALKIILDMSSNIYVANYSNPSCAIACITQNNNWLTRYNSNLLFGNRTPNAVPDRDTKNTYFYASLNNGALPVIYSLDQTNVLTRTSANIAGAGDSEYMTLGLSYNSQKFLAILSSRSGQTLRITFVPFTTLNTLYSGFCGQTSTGLNINSQFYPGCIVFADISNTKKSLFISTTSGVNTPTQNTQFIRVEVNSLSSTGTATITSSFITISFPGGIIPVVSYMAVYPVYQSGSYTKYLYIGERDDSAIYRVNIDISGNAYVATTYITTNSDPGYFNGCQGLSLDDNGYLYDVQGNNNPVLYRAIPNTPDIFDYITLNNSFGTLISDPGSLVYCNWDESLFTYSTSTGRVVKYYIGFPFVGMNSVNTIGPYDDTGYIFDITLGANVYKLNFNIYTPYIVIDPSNIPINTPSEVSIHFVIPFVQPAPTDSYKLLCDGQYISDVFCNNCTYNKSKFLSGTYPTGLVYSFFSNYLYVALQNNTISRIDRFGIVENNYIPTSAGLNGPTSLVLDASFNMFVLNAGSTYITKIILENNILDIDNAYFTGINTPICLTYDTYSNDYLYLLSGTVPTMRLTKILASDPTQNQIIGLPFGTLYNSNGLTIGEFNPGEKFLYVSNTDQFGNYSIVQIPLPYTLLSLPSRLGSYLSFKPYTMANKNDGYLYVANKTNNSISKISVDSVLITPNSEQPWASVGISVPAGLCFDGSGNLYVANSGTSPRNSRVSKIYIDYFFFTNVVIDSTPCEAQIYDLTTKSFVDVGYYPLPTDQTIFPIPVPFPINS